MNPTPSHNHTTTATLPCPIHVIILSISKCFTNVFQDPSPSKSRAHKWVWFSDSTSSPKLTPNSQPITKSSTAKTTHALDILMQFPEDNTKSKIAPPPSLSQPRAVDFFNLFPVDPPPPKHPITSVKSADILELSPPLLSQAKLRRLKEIKPKAEMTSTSKIVIDLTDSDSDIEDAYPLSREVIELSDSDDMDVDETANPWWMSHQILAETSEMGRAGRSTPPPATPSHPFSLISRPLPSFSTAPEVSTNPKQTPHVFHRNDHLGPQQIVKPWDGTLQPYDWISTCQDFHPDEVDSRPKGFPIFVHKFIYFWLQLKNLTLLRLYLCKICPHYTNTCSPATKLRIRTITLTSFPFFETPEVYWPKMPAAAMKNLQRYLGQLKWPELQCSKDFKATNGRSPPNWLFVRGCTIFYYIFCSYTDKSAVPYFLCFNFWSAHLYILSNSAELARSSIHPVY